MARMLEEKHSYILPHVPATPTSPCGWHRVMLLHLWPEAAQLPTGCSFSTSHPQTCSIITHHKPSVKQQHCYLIPCRCCSHLIQYVSQKTKQNKKLILSKPGLKIHIHRNSSAEENFVFERVLIPRPVKGMNAALKNLQKRWQ